MKQIYERLLDKCIYAGQEEILNDFYHDPDSNIDTMMIDAEILEDLRKYTKHHNYRFLRNVPQIEL